MMTLANNMLAAYAAGKASQDERLSVLRDMVEGGDAAEVIDIIGQLDAMPEMQELREEFDESIDRFDDFVEHKVNVR